MDIEQWITENRSLEQELIDIRRYLHQHPETGSDLSLTSAFIIEQLERYGYQPERIAGDGVTALAGSPGGPVLLLRTDMDALPVQEETGLKYGSDNGAMHACGHDLHMSMLLGAAKLLKEHEAQLPGQVKLMFQPHEEGLVGARRMIEAGILEEPAVHAALALHVSPVSEYPTGTIQLREGYMTAASTIFQITVTGRSAHGAEPHKGIDPINIAARIYLAFQELIARELPASSTHILTVASFHGGTTHNIIPETAEMRGSLRSYHQEEHQFILRRMAEIGEHLAAAFGGTCKIEHETSVNSTWNDAGLTEQIRDYNREWMGEKIARMPEPWTVSEDFARIAAEVPAVLAVISAGTAEEGYRYPLHNARAVFDENTMMYGCGYLYHTAVQWLKNSSTGAGYED